jgi:hypothetical protein
MTCILYVKSLTAFREIKTRHGVWVSKERVKCTYKLGHVWQKQLFTDFNTETKSLKRCDAFTVKPNTSQKQHIIIG